jgi:hypothetical protein
VKHSPQLFFLHALDGSGRGKGDILRIRHRLSMMITAAAVSFRCVRETVILPGKDFLKC